MSEKWIPPETDPCIGCQEKSCAGCEHFDAVLDYILDSDEGEALQPKEEHERTNT